MDTYLTDGAPSQGYDWNVAAQGPQTAPMVPYQHMVPYHPPQVDEHLEAQRERRMVTLRMVIALTVAIPITAIMAGAFAPYSPVFQLVGIIVGWVGIGAIVWLSQGRGLSR
ncbi:hypothetical protein GCM10009785_12130 [Brooklawnia cerclae]